jgi:hypothetical protein
VAIAFDNGNAIVCLNHRQVIPSPRLVEFVRYYDHSDVIADGTASYPFAVSVLPVLAFYLGAPRNAYEHDTARSRRLPPVIALGLCDHRVADLLDRGRQVLVGGAIASDRPAQQRQDVGVVQPVEEEPGSLRTEDLEDHLEHGDTIGACP